MYSYGSTMAVSSNHLASEKPKEKDILLFCSVMNNQLNCKLRNSRPPTVASLQKIYIGSILQPRLKTGAETALRVCNIDAARLKRLVLLCVCQVASL